MEEAIIQKAQRAFRMKFGSVPMEIEKLPQAGSARVYFRLSDRKNSCILCISDNVEENNTFLELTDVFFEAGLPVPEIYEIMEDRRAYLLQDLGDKTFLDFLLKDRERKIFSKYVEEITDSLLRFQFLPERQWKGAVGFAPFGEDLIRYDFNYALEQFVLPAGVEFSHEKLNKDFDCLCGRLLSFPKEFWGFMYRDFQSRNIMLTPAPYFIDYQSGRKGPCIYDLCSFCWQARAGYSREERMEIISCYISKLTERFDDAEKVIMDNIGYWAAFRLLQVLGAYGLRGIKEGKRHFIESIPPAIDNIKSLFTDYGLTSEMPELSRLIDRLALHYDVAVSR